MEFNPGGASALPPPLATMLVWHSCIKVGNLVLSDDVPIRINRPYLNQNLLRLVIKTTMVQTTFVIAEKMNDIDLGNDEIVSVFRICGIFIFVVQVIFQDRGAIVNISFVHGGIVNIFCRRRNIFYISCL